MSERRCVDELRRVSTGDTAASPHTAAALAPFAGDALVVPLGSYGLLFFLLATVSVAAALIAPWTGSSVIRRRSGRRPRSIDQH